MQHRKNIQIRNTLSQEENTEKGKRKKENLDEKKRKIGKIKENGMLNIYTTVDKYWKKLFVENKIGTTLERLNTSFSNEGHR